MFHRSFRLFRASPGNSSATRSVGRPCPGARDASQARAGNAESTKLWPRRDVCSKPRGCHGIDISVVRKMYESYMIYRLVDLNETKLLDFALNFGYINTANHERIHPIKTATCNVHPAALQTPHSWKSLWLERRHKSSARKQQWPWLQSPCFQMFVIMQSMEPIESNTCIKKLVNYGKFSKLSFIHMVTDLK